MCDNVLESVDIHFVDVVKIEPLFIWFTVVAVRVIRGFGVGFSGSLMFCRYQNQLSLIVRGFLK